MDDEGYMALMLAIVYPAEITPEEAFELLDRGVTRTEDLERLRQAGLTYGEISAMTGVTKGAVFNRIKRRRLRAMLDEEVE